MSELSRFVYIKSHVTLLVKASAQKVNCLSVASPKMFADDTNITVAANSLTELENKINLHL